MLKFQTTKAYFVTTSSFNTYALDFAHDIPNLELIEYKQLLKMLNADHLILSRTEFQSKLEKFWAYTTRQNHVDLLLPATRYMDHFTQLVRNLGFW